MVLAARPVLVAQPGQPPPEAALGPVGPVGPVEAREAPLGQRPRAVEPSAAPVPQISAARHLDAAAPVGRTERPGAAGPPERPGAVECWDQPEGTRAAAVPRCLRQASAAGAAGSSAAPASRKPGVQVAVALVVVALVAAQRPLVVAERVGRWARPSVVAAPPEAAPEELPLPASRRRWAR